MNYKKVFLLALFGGILLLNIGGLSAQDDTDQGPGIETEFLFDLHLDIESPLPISGGPYGDRRIFRVIGGTVDGPQISGEVIAGGSDWGLDRADGVSELDARITIRTDDDQIIYMSYTGIIYNSPEGELYWRMVPRFEAGDEYAWLTRIVAVGLFTDFGNGAVEYRVYIIR